MYTGCYKKLFLSLISFLCLFILSCSSDKQEFIAPISRPDELVVNVQEFINKSGLDIANYQLDSVSYSYVDQWWKFEYLGQIQNAASSDPFAIGNVGLNIIAVRIHDIDQNQIHFFE